MNRAVPIFAAWLMSVALVAGCGPSEAAILATVDAKVLTSIASVPTATPQPTATVIALPSPLPTATPQPTPTPVPVPTPQPTATPVVVPTPLPTATPMATATPQPTATPFPTATPQSTATPQPAVNFSEVYLKTWPAVFYVEASAKYGTGWLVEPGLILTARHVIEGAQSVTIRRSSSSPFTASVVASDSSRDIALLRYDQSSVILDALARPIPMATEVTTETNASPVLVLGYSEVSADPDGSVGAVPAKVGVQSQIQVNQSPSVQILRIDAPVDPGDSGGPVLNQSGQAIGMILASGTNDDGTSLVGVFYALAIHEIRNVLPTLKSGSSR